MIATVDTTREASEADRESGPILVVRLERKIQGRYRLNKPRLTLGRSKTADIRMQEGNGVSRLHAHLLVVDGEAVVEDLGSRNGTFVNGMLTKRRTLRPGDRITVGRYRLQFFLQSDKQGRKSRPANRVSELLRLWRPAAIVPTDSGCPLCHDHAADHADKGSLKMHPADEANDADSPLLLSTDAASEDADGDMTNRLRRIEIDRDFPAIPDVEDDLDEDAIMEKVRRLVGSADDEDEDEDEDEASANGKSRSRYHERKPKKKRRMESRSKPGRRSRLRR